MACSILTTYAEVKARPCLSGLMKHDGPLEVLGRIWGLGFKV